MKFLAGTTLALALSVASVCPSLTEPALSQDNMTTRSQVTRQIESIDGSTVTVRTPEGTTQTYEIDPAAIASLRLGQGSTIQLGPNLTSGEIVRVGPRNVLVKLDNGETENFIVTREDLVTIDPGDRVIVTPDRRITRAENYILRTGDVIPVQTSATTTDTTSTSTTQLETGTTTTEVVPTPTTSPTTPSTTTEPTPSTTTEAPPASSAPVAEEAQPVQQPVRALW